MGWTRAVDRRAATLLQHAARALQALGISCGRQRETVNLFMLAASEFEGTLRAEMCGHAMTVSWSRGAVDEIEHEFRFGMDAVTGDERDRRARVLLHTGYGQAIAHQRGETEHARHQFAQARQLLERLDDPRSEASVRVAAARNETTVGDFDAALALLVPALRHFALDGDVAGAADAQSRLAMVFAEQYRVGPALAADREVLRLYTVVGSRPRAAVSELNVGASFLLCGAWAKRGSTRWRGSSSSPSFDDHALDAYTSCRLAEIHAGRGESTDAAHLFTTGVTAIRAAGDGLGLRLKLPEWGRYLTDAGRHEEALLVLREAVDVWTAIGGEHFFLS